MNPELETIVESALDSLGFDLVDLRRQGSRMRPVFEVRIDRRDDEKVTVDDCARVSRALEQRLDANAGALVGDRYELQVSSPGADRPLKTERDWRRFVGRTASVKSAQVGGRREVEIVAVEGTGADAAVVLHVLGGPGGQLSPGGDAMGTRSRSERVPLSAIDEARLTFHWDRGVTDDRFG